MKTGREPGGYIWRFTGGLSSVIAGVSFLGTSHTNLFVSLFVLVCGLALVTWASIDWGRARVKQRGHTKHRDAD